MASGEPTQRRRTASSTRNHAVGGSSRVRIAWRASRVARRALTSSSVTPGSTVRIARAYSSVCSSPDKTHGCHRRRVAACCSCSIQLRNHGG